PPAVALCRPVPVGLAPARAPPGGGAGVPAVIEGEAELVLAEKLVEKLPAQGSDRVQAVVLRVVLEKNRRERLRRRARHHSRAFGGIVLAVLRAAVDDMGEPASGRLLVAVADEADLAGGVGQPVGADRG